MKRKATARKKPTWCPKSGGPFAKYEGIGNPGIGSGMKSINRWLRNLRGR
jgi:hypothetical protein